jgi:hypothetical protein
VVKKPLIKESNNVNTKKGLSIFLLLFGECLIIAGFLYFGKSLPSNILTLDIIISSIIYSLYFIRLVLPGYDFGGKSQKGIGSLGIKGFFLLFYTCCAIGLMLKFNADRPVDFGTQIIVHGILLFVLFLGTYFSLTASQKVHEVFTAENNNRVGLDAIIRATAEALRKVKQAENVPKDITARLSAFQDNLRFISPGNVNETANLENELLSEIGKLNDSILQHPVEYDKINRIIQTCETIYLERKQIYTN